VVQEPPAALGLPQFPPGDEIQLALVAPPATSQASEFVLL
jgi:hypothetical protein